MVMRVFVAGGTGVLGRRLVPQLVARGHQVTATTTSAAKLGLVAEMGAGAVVDGLDAVSVGEAVGADWPEVIVHQMTAISMTHAGKPAAPSSCRCSRTYSRTSSRTSSASHLARPSKCCMPSGVAPPAHSAMLQQFLRGRSDSSPSTRSRTRPQDKFTGANRAAIPAHQDLERLLPAGRVYAMVSGYRKIVSLHTPMISGGRSLAAAGPPAKIKVYGWRSRWYQVPDLPPRWAGVAGPTGTNPALAGALLGRGVVSGEVVTRSVRSPCRAAAIRHSSRTVAVATPRRRPAARPGSRVAGSAVLKRSRTG